MEKKIAASIRKLNKEIAKEWRATVPELNRCIRAGEYESEGILRAGFNERQRELVHQWQEWRLTLPPFRTKEKGYYMQHPVTQDNVHLLSFEQARAALQNQ